MAHYVICSVCGVKFNRDAEQAVRTSARRYAHFECSPKSELVPLPEGVVQKKAKEKANKDLIELESFIKNLFKIPKVPVKISRQIETYRSKYNYSYSGILKSLVYFYNVKANTTEKSNGGIGIVPYVYEDAYNYYYELFIASNRNNGVDVKKMVTKVKEITIKMPKVIEPPKKMFNLDDEEKREND